MTTTENAPFEKLEIHPDITFQFDEPEIQLDKTPEIQQDKKNYFDASAIQTIQFNLT